MSESKQTEKTPDMEELVDFTAPVDPTGEKRDILLSVNGETIRVKRGQTVRVKRKFLEVWDNANRQALAARDAMERAQEGSRAPALEM